MAHLWMRDEAAEWAVARLEGDLYTFVSAATRIEGRPPADGEAALIRTTLGPADSEWVLLLADWTSGRVNGTAVLAGITVLRDRDEIQGLPAGQCFFSTEQLVSVVSAPDGGRPICCPRCMSTIEPATLAVCCPVCGVWHHQDHDDERRCWSYSEECAVCRHDTALDRGYGWSPEELG